MQIHLNRQEWINKIIEDAIKYSNEHERSVLIISQKINFSEELIGHLRNTKKDQEIVECYDHKKHYEFEKIDAGKKETLSWPRIQQEEVLTLRLVVRLMLKEDSTLCLHFSLQMKEFKNKHLEGQAEMAKEAAEHSTFQESSNLTLKQ